MLYRHHAIIIFATLFHILECVKFPIISNIYGEGAFKIKESSKTDFTTPRSSTSARVLNKIQAILRTTRRKISGKKNAVSRKFIREYSRYSIPDNHKEIIDAAKKPFRGLGFWRRAAHIYSSYKTTQVKSFILKSNEKTANSTASESLWDAVHEINSKRMMDLCLSLRGFYLKTGQFLGTRHDFMPIPFTSKLAKLHDDVPPLDSHIIRGILEKELTGKLEDFFTFLDLNSPIGAASVAQVHYGIWKKTGEKVAVKVQYPHAEKLMKGDLRNLRALAEFLQRTELKFDLLSAIKELQKQIVNEFDFNREAQNMDLMYHALKNRVPEVVLPHSIFSSRNALIMTYLDGSNLSRLAEFRNKHGNIPLLLRKQIGKKLLDTLAKAWGVMIFEQKFFNADPHPGNIIYRTGGSNKVGLLDWGQMKRLPDDILIKFAKLVEALNSKDNNRIIKQFFELGVRVEKPENVTSVSFHAKVMFDTCQVPGYDINPFSPTCALRENSVTSLPPDIYFVMRTVQLMRGITFAFNIDYSLAQAWSPYARKLLVDAGVAN